MLFPAFLPRLSDRAGKCALHQCLNDSRHWASQVFNTQHSDRTGDAYLDDASSITHSVAPNLSVYNARPKSHVNYVGQFSQK